MCGLVGTIVSKTVDFTTRVETTDISSALTKFYKTDNAEDCETLYELARRYRTDCNFLAYFDSEYEREEIEKILERIATLKSSSQLGIPRDDHELLSDGERQRTQHLEDIEWFLGTELKLRYDFVSEFLNYKDLLKPEIIVFYKALKTIINAINILEIRPRDLQN